MVEKKKAKTKKKLSSGGRLLVRRSGTEPVLRIMGEHENEALLEEILKDIAAAVPEN